MRHHPRRPLPALLVLAALVAGTGTAAAAKSELKEWQGTKPDERKMMSDFMKQMSKSEAAFSAEIKQGGVLGIDGNTAQLAVRTGTAGNESVFSQNFELEGGEWRIAP